MTTNCNSHPSESGRVDEIQHASDRELLGQLIGMEAARSLYSGSLRPFFEPGDQLPPPASCIVARELVKRWLVEEVAQRPVFASPDSVKDFLKVHFAGREYESFVVLYLNAQHCLIEWEELFRGTLSQTSVYPREVVKSALRHNAGAVMFAHNHPSGSPLPSRADEHLTQTLKTALSMVDVRVLDHFVVAGPGVMSFAERGML